MRAILEVMQFEIRYQLRSPFILGALLLYALIHFLSITSAAIHIGDISNQVAINSAYAVLQPGRVLGCADLTTKQIGDRNDSGLTLRRANVS